MTDQPAPGHRATTARPVRVVLVEDHALVRDQIVGRLRTAGIEILDAVGTLQEGHRSIADHRPDVVVLDNHLPDGLGIDLCRELSQEHPELPVVIYSGHLTPDDRERASRAGAVAVVPKTFTGRELLAAITSHAVPL